MAERTAPPASKLNFEMDAVCRVAVCGYLESGLDGVVFVKEAAKGGSVMYIPLRTENEEAKAWPEMLRRRLSYEITKDNGEHFFIVWRDAATRDYHMAAILRSAAEAVVQRGGSLEEADVVTDPEVKRIAQEAATHVEFS